MEPRGVCPTSVRRIPTPVALSSPGAILRPAVPAPNARSQPIQRTSGTGTRIRASRSRCIRASSKPGIPPPAGRSRQSLPAESRRAAGRSGRRAAAVQPADAAAPAGEAGRGGAGGAAAAAATSCATDTTDTAAATPATAAAGRSPRSRAARFSTRSALHLEPKHAICGPQCAAVGTILRPRRRRPQRAGVFHAGLVTWPGRAGSAARCRCGRYARAASGTAAAATCGVGTHIAVSWSCGGCSGRAIRRAIFPYPRRTAANCIRGLALCTRPVRFTPRARSPARSVWRDATRFRGVVCCGWKAGACDGWYRIDCRYLMPRWEVSRNGAYALFHIFSHERVGFSFLSVLSNCG
ncbi:hypothetical protein BOTBODRAFT_507542 [Botryobasidium botryosum FD-172 SS1]|uniref:Uncharacterized protein n=1 Tax=Botryobasidium botryosum (strain FD-172 SS1) TaxID=930990 RepID=A0A067M4Y8_BOTB1|nr:hypothetical protein BOTBODRAFT_507542 [Botryobasidium botryosum FD-172 SS1]